MANVALEESQLKSLLKSALIEVLEERRDLLRGLVDEAIEDIALARAIEEGETTPIVERSEVFRVLGEPD
jgi:hypothetical protein